MGLDVFAIVTTRPNAFVARVHTDWMPVIFEAADHAAWLSRTREAAAWLLHPLPMERMRLMRQGAGGTADRD